MASSKSRSSAPSKATPPVRTGSSSRRTSSFGAKGHSPDVARTKPGIGRRGSQGTKGGSTSSGGSTPRGKEGMTPSSGKRKSISGQHGKSVKLDGKKDQIEKKSETEQVVVVKDAFDV